MNEPLSLGLISYIVLYQMILQKHLSYKNERKTMRGEAFWGLKNPENPGASGGSSPWTPAEALPLDPTPLGCSARYACFALTGHKLFLFSTPQLQILHTPMVSVPFFFALLTPKVRP